MTIAVAWTIVFVIGEEGDVCAVIVVGVRLGLAFYLSSEVMWKFLELFQMLFYSCQFSFILKTYP